MEEAVSGRCKAFDAFSRDCHGTLLIYATGPGAKLPKFCPLQSLVVCLFFYLSSIFSFFSRTGGVLVLPRHARCVLSCLRCNGYSFLLSSYLSRIVRIEKPSSSAYEHPSQDTSHLILHCPATEFLRRSLFGDSLSLYDL